ncbi:MAG: tetratricopeptide repeat protein [Flavobacteriales bacterium]|nr:tetratricopeptide repeat protein [Flavobacteriales bacterium]MCB9197220.1 tetratricopeptide repeat protein [Flavobacteriales bacterium]
MDLPLQIIVHLRIKRFLVVLKSYPKILWLIIAVTFLCYIRMLDAGFVNFDDDKMVYQNPLITSLSIDNITKYFSEPTVGIYQPLTMLSLSIDHVVAGMSPKYFHFINVLLHVLNTILVFRFIQLLAKDDTIALIVAALFGVHTLHVESVAWINARKDVLFALFYLLALIKFIRYLDNGQKLQLIWSLLFFVLSCLSKPLAVSFTLVLPLIQFYKGEGVKEWMKLKNWTIYFPFAGMSILFGLMIYWHQKENIPDNEQLFQGWGRQVVFALDGVSSYLLRTILPLKLSVIYNYPAKLGEAIPILTFIKAIGAVIWIGLTFWWVRKNRNLAFGSLFFLVNIVFVLQIIPMGVGYQADRFLYIPIIGLFWIIAYQFKQFLERKKMSLATFKSVIVSYTILLSVLTISRTGDWKDSLSLWNATIKVNDQSYIAYNNRGQIYMELKDWNNAIADFTSSIQIEDNVKAFYNRGTSYANIANWKLAEKDLLRSLDMDSMNAEAYGNLGVVYMSLIQDSLSYKYLNKAIELDPENQMHRSNLELLKSYMNP